MSCGCKCSYCVSCNCNPPKDDFKTTTVTKLYKKPKDLYTKKQAD